MTSFLKAPIFYYLNIQKQLFYVIIILQFKILYLSFGRVFAPQISPNCLILYMRALRSKILKAMIDIPEYRVTAYHVPRRYGFDPTIANVWLKILVLSYWNV